VTEGWLPHLPPQALRPVPATATGAQTSPVNRASFQNVLARALPAPNSLKVSAHAEHRLQEHGVQWSESDWGKVQSAVDLAGGKGARDAYLVYGQVGLVVNVPNRTVVTALEHGPRTVVTNIDSVVVV